MMVEKKGLFSIIKRFLFSDANSRSEKKEKKQTWIHRLLRTKHKAPLAAPPDNQIPETAEDRKSDASVIFVTDDVQSAHQENESPESSGSKIHDNYLEVARRYEKAIQDFAIIKIQAAYRGYLARKALRALKGVVKLQAIIRGWAVRKQAMNTLKCLQSIVNIHSEVCSKRRQRSVDGLQCQVYEQDPRENDSRVDFESQKRWDDSMLTRQESKAHTLSKREASLKRERIKEYYLLHRRSAETERDKVFARRKYWLEQWVNGQLAKRDDLWNSDGSLLERKNHEAGGRQLSVKNPEKQHHAEMSVSPANTMRRSPHHRRQRSTGDSNSFAGSPTIPAYMLPTTSAKAKARSLSSPRQRPFNFDVCSEIASPYKHKLSPISSINSELTSSSWIGNSISSFRRSPNLQSLPSPKRSTVSKRENHLQGIHYQNGIGASGADYAKLPGFQPI